MIALDELGFHSYFATRFAELDRPDLAPARIAADGQNAWHLAGCRAVVGELSGRLRNELEGIARPGVGDWVAVADGQERAVIHYVLDRQTALIRRAAYSARGQLIAANLDLVGVVTSANRDLNPRRIERYLTAVWDSGASPLVILNKVDLVADAGPMIEEIEDVALGVPVIAVSAHTGEGLDALRAHLEPGITIGFVGSSGVGKSSLVNRLLGREAQLVKDIREDDARGRHTTTRRELIVLPTGGVLIDTPGMRELGLTEDSGGVDTTFADITELATQCRFADCRHESEPSCAVREALAIGALDAARWKSYRKLQREIAVYEARRDPVLAAERGRELKRFSKSIRAHARLSQKP